MDNVATVSLVAKAEVIPDFDAFVEEHRPRVFRFLFANLRDRDEAETLTQETFLKAYRARKSFRGDASANTWIMRIAVNCLRDQLRSRRWQFWRRHSQSIDAAALSECLPDGSKTPEALTVAREQVATVWRAAEQLTPKQRAVFMLRFVEDMEIAEIAAATGTAQGTVKAHLFQSLQAIRSRLVSTR